MIHCLPVPAFWWFPEDHADGPRRVVVPAGTAVHATCAGRVTQVDDQAVGTVVVRDRQERFHHFRRLRASSITVREADEVEGGVVLGVVAMPNDGSVAALLYGVHDADDRWLDVLELMVGANDPPPAGPNAALSDDASARGPLLRPEPSPLATRSEPVAVAASVEEMPTAAVPIVHVPQRGAGDEVGREVAETATDALDATGRPERTIAEPADPAEPLIGEPEEQRSKLAARRPPRRST